VVDANHSIEQLGLLLSTAQGHSLLKQTAAWRPEGLLHQSRLQGRWQ